jgi:glycosyltransferase involved in cell wall biosynthesis
MLVTIISYYELGEKLRAVVGDRPGEVRFAAISKLSRGSPLQFFRQIRGLRADTIAVAVSDDNARPFVGPLILLAAMSGSKNIEILWPDRTPEKVTRRGVATWFVKILAAQISSRRAFRKAKRHAKLFESREQNLPLVPRNSRRVLYLNANLPLGAAVGGSVGHTRGVIDELVREGFCVDYASGKAIPTDIAESRWLKVPCEDFLAMPPELNCYAFNEIFERHVTQWATENSYAFIYQRMSVHNFTGAILRRTLGIPLIIEYNGSEVWAAANWDRRLRLHDVAVSAERASLSNADLVVTVSGALADELAAAGVSRERIVVYPNCIDPQIFNPNRFSSEAIASLRNRLNIGEGARIATFIGTFGTWHGADFLARAICRLIDEDLAWVVEHKLHFLLIGDGLKMPEVQALLGRRPYSDFVTLTGAIPQTDAPAFLAASDVFLCPHVPNWDGSTFFGSPTKLFEYMAMQRPIVASDLAQIGSVLRGTYFGPQDNSAGPSAMLFTPGSEDGFLIALREVVENPYAAREMATEARRVALGSFTWQQHVHAILARAEQAGLQITRSEHRGA